VEIDHLPFRRQRLDREREFALPGHRRSGCERVAGARAIRGFRRPSSPRGAPGPARRWSGLAGSPLRANAIRLAESAATPIQNAAAR
jgi:hypothetical protein